MLYKNFIRLSQYFANSGGVVIKPFIVIAALLLVTACSSNQSANNQMTTQQTKVGHHAGKTATTSNLTQASSISTENAGNSTLKTKQVPGDVSKWLDGFIRTTPPTGGTTADQTTYPQTSARPQYSANPQQSANPQYSANPQTSTNSSASVQKVLELVNKERTNAGLKPLSLNSELSKMALAKAQDMSDNNYFDHQSPTYGSPFDMMKAFGISYNTAGENIAKGQSSPEEVMNQWMNSPGHRANILNSSFTEIGIGYYNSEWVQEFIG
ncbi:CAP domain-containing protein [Paenibacillus sp. Marseille-Q9583]